ncbi:RING finger domain protein [Pleurostoma richardsiae]|uniref:RING-type E3 ubiquitin transferase n=1 Tax=Pleurostoma richardsiae TaxID=41990 RepID=A0AA38RV61_9PEZI|nr:RING finger domain protein [Pleurostoma richardsiae]
MDNEDVDRADVQRRVLQSTLTEISAQHDDDAELCCVICLDSVAEPCVAKPCAHRNFDFLCLVSWLQESPACPLCKATISQVRYEFSDDAASWKTFEVPPPAKKERSATNGGRADPTAARRPHPIYERSRLAQRGRRRRDYPEPRPAVTPDEALLRRRHVYRNRLYSLHVGSNRVSRYRDLTPRMFETDPGLVSRARMWIRRELQVFEFLSAGSGDGTSTDDAARRRRASNAEFLLEYIVAILKTVDIQGSCGQAEDMLQEFLGRDNTQLFLHELRSWLRSPHGSLEAWDRNVQYDESKAAVVAGRDGAAPPREEPRRDTPTYYRPRGRDRYPRGERRYRPYGPRRPYAYESRMEAAQRYVPD